MIRVPYYCPKTFIESDKKQPDDRELEEIDPFYQINSKDIVKIRVGAPIILKEILEPDKYN